MIERQNDTNSEPKTGARLRQRLIGGMVIVALIALILPLWLDTGGLKSPTVQPVPTAPTVAQPDQINIPAPSASQMHALANPPPAVLPQSEPNPATNPTVTASTPTETLTPPVIRAAIPPAEKAKPPAPSDNRKPTERPVVLDKPASAEKPAPVEPSKPVERPSKPTIPEASKPIEPAKPPVEAMPEKSTATAEPQAIVPSSSSGEWVVQLGSFSDELNARALAKSVEEAGFRVNLSPLFAKKGTVWRVRVGPYKTRDQAIQTTVLLREKLGRDGLVMPNK